MCNKLKVKLAVYISTYKTVFTAVLKTIISNIFNCFQLIMPLFGSKGQKPTCANLIPALLPYPLLHTIAILQVTLC